MSLKSEMGKPFEKKTNEQFLMNLTDRNKYYREGLFKVLDKYEKASSKIRIQSKYGICEITPNSLLNGANPTTIQSATDKSEFFRQNLNDTNKYFRDGLYEVVGEYKGARKQITVRSEYAEHLVIAGSLLKDVPLSSSTAIDKTKYYRNKFIEIHGEEYDYSKMKVEHSNSDIIIGCKIHGDVKISVQNHLYRKCPECGTNIQKEFCKKFNGGWGTTEWKNKATKSKNFDSFKLYIIYCMDFLTGEYFFKVGKTFLKVHERFHSTSLPYEYEIVYIYEGDGKIISELENKIKRDNSENYHRPSMNFNGCSECYNKIYDIDKKNIQI